MSPATRTIIDLNIKRYRDLLETETGHKKRKTLSRLLAEEEAKLARMEEWGDNGEERPQPDIRDLGDRRGRSPSMYDLKAVRTSIGAALRGLHSDMLGEELPDRIAELLRQIDRQTDTDGG
jgi:hypothetical protein